MCGRLSSDPVLRHGVDQREGRGRELGASGCPAGAFAEVSLFRSELYACLTARGAALFELRDALLCTGGPVRTLVGLALAPEHRRGHLALYGGLDQGRIDVTRLRRALVEVSLPRAADGRLVLAVGVSPWLRPDANTCADRAFCHTFGGGEGKRQMMPGWPYSVVAALETGRTSWTAVLDAVRLEPCVDVAAVTTMQIREVVERPCRGRPVEAGRPGNRGRAGRRTRRPAHRPPAGRPAVEILGRLLSTRVMRRPRPSREELHRANPQGRSAARARR